MEYGKDFSGLFAAVTGAGSGIGLAVAHQLKARGATVYGLDVAEGAMGESATFIRCDIGDDASAKAAFAQISQLDILINNAAISSGGTVESNSDDEWAKVLNVNVIGVARVSRAALPLLRQSSHASIVNTCSVVATAGVPNRVLYSAAKGAILSMTLAMANDHLSEKIRVNCVNPGTADTPWVARLLQNAADPVEEKRLLEARQPIGRLVSADEVANAICYLASPLQASTTATSLAVDGGMQGLRISK